MRARVTWKPPLSSSMTHVGEFEEVTPGLYHMRRRGGGYWQIRAEYVVKMEMLQ